MYSAYLLNNLPSTGCLLSLTGRLLVPAVNFSSSEAHVDISWPGNRVLSRCYWAAYPDLFPGRIDPAQDCHPTLLTIYGSGGLDDSIASILEVPVVGPSTGGVPEAHLEVRRYT